MIKLHWNIAGLICISWKWKRYYALHFFIKPKYWCLHKDDSLPMGPLLHSYGLGPIIMLTIAEE